MLSPTSTNNTAVAQNYNINSTNFHLELNLYYQLLIPHILSELQDQDDHLEHQEGPPQKLKIPIDQGKNMKLQFLL